DCVTGAERFFTSFGSGQVVGQGGESLVNVVYLHITARFLSDSLFKRLLQFGFDDKDHAAKTGAVSVIDRVVEDNLSAWAKRVNLFEAAIAGTHPGSHNDQNRLIHILVISFPTHGNQNIIKMYLHYT